MAADTRDALSTVRPELILEYTEIHDYEHLDFVRWVEERIIG